MTSRREREDRDSLNLLYSNSFPGFLISVVTSTAMVFAFNSESLQSTKMTWWLVFVAFIFLRFCDALYWKYYLEPTAFAVRPAFWRFFFGSTFTAVLWATYVLFMIPVVSHTELAFTFAIISGMAGGAATILAGSRFAAGFYTSILLFPISLYLLTFDDAFLRYSGVIGMFFGVVMLVSAFKSANLTANTIKVKHDNRELVDEMKLEQEEIKRINHELGVAYDRINATNSSLEEEVAKRTEEIYRLSNLDPLTKLFNRNAFAAALEGMLADEYTIYSVAILFIDLDGFKQINDALGHDVGDEVLNQITHRLSRYTGNGYLGRWGGDEFVFAFPNLDTSVIFDRAEKIILSVAKPIAVGSLNLNVGASVGISFYPQHGSDVQELVQYADIAMYEHKRSGAKSACVFAPELLTSLQEKEILREGLRAAVSKDDLFLLYQPIVSSNDQNISSCEALLRWRYQDQVIKPDEFIDICEQSGLIVEVGFWVLKKACKDAALWNKDRECKVSVNVSVVQLFDDSFLKYLDIAIKESGLKPALLVIEITESTFASNQHHLRGLLNEIKQRGVKLAIDDFGVGYSSMSQLQMLPFDFIKVDRSFIERIDEGGEAIVKATLFLAKELDCETVAEGIESQEQVERLKALGADYFQGFYFSQPVPCDKVAGFINNGKIS